MATFLGQEGDVSSVATPRPSCAWCNLDRRQNDSAKSMRKVRDGVKLPNTCAECSLHSGEGEKKTTIFCFFAQEGTVKQQPLWLSPLPRAHQGLTLAHKDVRSTLQFLHASAREIFVIVYSLFGVELVAAWSCLSLALVIQATDRQTDALSALRVHCPCRTSLPGEG